MVIVSSPVKARNGDNAVARSSMPQMPGVATPQKASRAGTCSQSTRAPSTGTPGSKAATQSSPLKVGSFASPMKKQRKSPLKPVAKGQTGFPVYVHVYDLGPVSKWVLNSWAARNGGSLGVFHVGVEVLGIEFSFQAMVDCKPDDDVSGLTWHHPKSHPRHVYRESVLLGPSPLGVLEIGGLLERLEKAWPASGYNCLNHNCTDFAEVLVAGLKVPEPFPTWVHGLAKGLTKSASLGDFSKQVDIFAACGSSGSCGSCASSKSSCGSCNSCGPMKAVNEKAQEIGAAAPSDVERAAAAAREQGREATADEAEEIFPPPSASVNRRLFPQD